MSINVTTIKLSLYNWATSILTDPFVWYYPNAPRPNVDYLSLFLNNLSPRGQDFVGQPDSTEISSVVGNREFSLRVQAYGGDVLTKLETLASSLQLPSVQEYLRSQGIVTIRQGTVNDITKLINTQFEGRGFVDLYFRIAQTQTDNNGLISTVDGDYIYDNAGTNITGSYTVP